MEPFITVVLPVRNEARFIRDTLEMLLRQDYPQDRFEIIVADGLSDDGTTEIVQETARLHPQIRWVSNPRRLSSAGRNLGFRLGQGDYFLVVDGHCHIDGNGLLRSVADCFARSGADCLGRPQPLDPPGLTPFQEAVALARSARIGHGGDSLIYGRHEGYASPVSNGAAYRRSVFEKIGYVDERLDACEDVEFNYRLERAGLTAYTSPDLTVRYYPRQDLGSLFRQMRRYGLGRFRFLQRHPQALRLETLVPPLFALGLFPLAGSAAALAAIRLWGAGLTGKGGGALGAATSVLFALLAFFGALYVLYLCLIGAVSLFLAARHGWRHLRHLPSIFFVIHLGLGWGFLEGLWEDPAPARQAPVPLGMDKGEVSQ